MHQRGEVWCRKKSNPERRRTDRPEQLNWVVKEPIQGGKQTKDRFPGQKYGDIPNSNSSFSSDLCMMCYQHQQICTDGTLQRHLIVPSVGKEEHWGTFCLRVKLLFPREDTHGGTTKYCGSWQTWLRKSGIARERN